MATISFTAMLEAVYGLRWSNSRRRRVTVATMLVRTLVDTIGFGCRGLAWRCRFRRPAKARTCGRGSTHAPSARSNCTVTVPAGHFSVSLSGCAASSPVGEAQVGVHVVIRQRAKDRVELLGAEFVSGLGDERRRGQRALLAFCPVEERFSSAWIEHLAVGQVRRLKQMLPVGHVVLDRDISRHRAHSGSRRTSAGRGTCQR